MSKTALKNISKLPSKCFGVLRCEQTIVLIKAGVVGYFETRIEQLPSHRRSGKTIDQIADYLNAKNGVTPAERAAMEAGSMWGWGVPAADVARYDASGNPVASYFDVLATATEIASDEPFAPVKPVAQKQVSALKDFAQYLNYKADIYSPKGRLFACDATFTVQNGKLFHGKNEVDHTRLWDGNGQAILAG